MKETYKIFGTMLFAALAATSCVDDDALAFDVEKPQSIAQYEYLNSYEPLKSYINRAAHPGFKASAALTAADFSKKESLYRLAAHNFDEVVAGNAMKMASCVNDKGAMDFSNVTSFVNAAEDAGLTVYGHTLAWHAQQPVKWLNNLIADRELPPDPNGGNKFMKIAMGETLPEKPNQWDKAINYVLPAALEAGAEYTLSMKVKSSEGATLALWLYWDASPNRTDWGTTADVQYLATYNVGKEYSTLTWTFTANNPHDKLSFPFGKEIGTLFVDDVTLVKTGSETNLVKNGDFATETAEGWGGANYTIATEAAVVELPQYVFSCTFDDGLDIGGWGNSSTKAIEDGGHDGGKCHVINNPSAVNPWECQAAIDFSDPLEEGKEYYLHFWAKAENEGTPNAAYQNPTNYSGRGDYPAFSVSPTWKEYTLKTTVTGDNCKRLCFNLGTVAGKIYLDDIEIYWTKKSNTIPLTDQEKKDTLTWAMDTWIKGMMDATDGKVKAWDVVNEAISGGGNVDGYYALQHSNAETKDDFFWQDADKLGDIDYVRTAVASARKHFKGDAADLKLFVNDYNLESTWDNNRKLESLIYWIGKWEADNVTKIDGIGTQMHISMVYGNDTTSLLENASRKAHIERMFRLMAESGKLCRVSELDLGVDTLNTATKEFEGVKTKAIEAMPLEKRIAIEKAQADYYQWILEKYFEIIPVAQQYGFCQWCLTDAPDEDRQWRRGEPVGLWNLNYQRKPAYAGWAEGLKN